MNNKMIDIREVALDDDVLSVLISMSKVWERENNVHGYVANEKSDIEGKRIFLACEDNTVIGYVLGKGYQSENMKSIMEEGSPCFEIDELYVMPEYRSGGVGKKLLDRVCELVKEEYAYITLTTATKNASAILRFYIEEMGMNFWSARLYKQL